MIDSHVKCDRCGEDPLYCVNGWLWLCWDHYCELMQEGKTRTE